MTPVSDFAIKDPYEYLYGFGNYHQSEAIPGANPQVINSPQKPPFGLRTEHISGSSFTAPRHQNYQTWLYRVSTSLHHSAWTPAEASSPPPPPPRHLTPDTHIWPDFPGVGDGDGDGPGADWIGGQRLLGRNGDPQAKSGLALWVFAVGRAMPARAAFASLDGEALVVPQAGALDVQTELGRMLVRQNEIAVIPRGVRYRVALPEGATDPCRGYICELFEGHFRLPDLGVVGSTGLANVRDFQVPTAYFDGELVKDNQGNLVARTSASTGGGGDWTITARLNGRLWSCTQAHTPFDVAAWHGTCHPFKYDLARFCVLGNALFDEHDPSLYTVLTATAHGSAPGTAVADVAVIPPRWQAAEGTYWLPYDHRNTMQEFYAPVLNGRPRLPALEQRGGGAGTFRPFGGGLNGAMATHGAADDEFRAARHGVDTSRPQKLQDDGVTLVLIEAERPLFLTDWAHACSVKNLNGKAREESKL
ncbi:homogentisate 1,2-dioxygenase [Xylariaceae sp. FL0804]|nr:homogentisate 1,2-dioxygenase [Xylariaceae sp. FL0804]